MIRLLTRSPGEVSYAENSELKTAMIMKIKDCEETLINVKGKAVPLHAMEALGGEDV
jgi:hypothetical protein